MNFYQDAPADPASYRQQQDMASALLKQGRTSPQGQMVGGQFVAPGAEAYASQLAGALAGGMKQNQLRNAPPVAGGQPQQAPLQKFGNWLGGLFGGN